MKFLFFVLLLLASACAPAAGLTPNGWTEVAPNTRLFYADDGRNVRCYHYNGYLSCVVRP